jgi:hypothetical protein
VEPATLLARIDTSYLQHPHLAHAPCQGAGSFAGKRMPTLEETLPFFLYDLSFSCRRQGQAWAWCSRPRLSQNNVGQWRSLWGVPPCRITRVPLKCARRGSSSGQRLRGVFLTGAGRNERNFRVLTPQSGPCATSLLSVPHRRQHAYGHADTYTSA